MNVSLVNLGKSFGARSLFEGVSLELNPGARYGLVGANGSGKTTLLKILAGAEPASEGAVVIPAGARVSVLRQDLSLDDGQRIIDLAMMGDAQAWAALQERTRIVDHGEGDPTRLAELEETIRLLDGSTLQARATAILVGLGIPQASHDQPLGTLSGGFKLRVLLAQVLLGGPDVLFLDEPTNHLDILSIRWLEKFLMGHRGVVLVISHDQRFLENVATHILDVDYGTITDYPGGFASFVVQKEENRARKEAEIARVEKTIADKKAWVERFGAKATKARQAQSRLKQIEKIEAEELDSLEKSSRRTPYFKFEPLRPSGRDVLEVKGISKAYGAKQVLKNVTLSVRRGERVAIIGPNGLGKSTLLKIVTGRVDADGGTATFGHEARVSYFAQDHHEILPDPDKTPLDVMWEAVPDESVSYVRGQLGRVLFSGEEVDKKIGKLSGGECARLVFARIASERPNVLLLDEPTNHLDLEAIGALVTALESFDGTVVFVSHDRAFVSKLATRILEIKPEGFTDFPGTYAEYLARLGDDHLDADAVVLKAKASAKDRAAPATDTTSWEAQKKKRNRLLALPARRDKILATIEIKEARKKAIHDGYAEAGFFERTPRAELEKLEAEEKAIDAEVATLMAEWEAIETELAEAGDEAKP